MCAGILGEEVLRRDATGAERCPPQERNRHLQHLTTAAENGVRPVMLPMAALYARGDGVLQDSEKAMALMTVAYITAGDEEEREAAAEFVHTIFPEYEGKLPLRPAITWLFEAAHKTKAAGLSAVAEDAWLKIGMELPTD